MSEEIAAVEKWLFDELASHIATVFEAMAGERPEVHWMAANSLPEQADFQWAQELPPLPGRLFVIGNSGQAIAAGGYILKAAGVDDGSDEELRATCTEALGQAISSLARSLTGKLQKEVIAANGQETTEDPEESSWATFTIDLGDSPVTLCVGLETPLVEAVANPPAGDESGGDAAANPLASNQAAVEATESRTLTAAAGASVATVQGPDSGSKTFDLLLDVEMPVSVSFGKAQVALKDVLKLTTGSIVELNRAIAEPVDIVVNNRVIARGEVVVVEGNFGVRIQQVVSRNERLRTLQ